MSQELLIEDLVVGSGEEVTAGKRVQVHSSQVGIRGFWA